MPRHRVDLGADLAQPIGQLLVGIAPIALFAAQVRRNAAIAFDHAGEVFAHQLAHFGDGRFRRIDAFELEAEAIQLDADLIDEIDRRRGERGALRFELRRDAEMILDVFAEGMPDGGFVMSFTDVTAERAAIEGLSRANETLEARVMARTLELEDALGNAERANASRSRFVAAASRCCFSKIREGTLRRTVAKCSIRCGHSTRRSSPRETGSKGRAITRSGLPSRISSGSSWCSDRKSVV